MDGAERQGFTIEPPTPAAARIQPQKLGGYCSAFSSDLLLDSWRHELSDTDMPKELVNFVLSGVSDGFRISNVSNDSTDAEPVEQENYSSVIQNHVAVQSQILSEITSGRYRVVEDRPAIVSAMGAIPKSSGNGVRLIHDCSQPKGKAVNDLFVSDSKIRFSSAANFRRRLRKDIYMGKVDLSQAYRSCGIHPDDHKLTGLKFTFDGDSEPTYMVDTRLPFGAAASVNGFFQVSNAIRFMMLKRKFYNFEVYMDDFGFAGSQSECWRFFTELTQLVQKLGFTVNWEKSVPPTKEMCFLGILFDTRSGLMTLPSAKVQELVEFIDVCISKSWISKRELQRLVGKLNWACQVIEHGRPFLRDLIDLVNLMDEQHSRLRIDARMKSVIGWWKVALLQQQGKELWFTNRKPVAMETDACLVGAAAILREPASADWCYMNWSMDANGVFADCCINYKEAAAALLSILRWRDRLHGCQVAVYCDNASACAIINKGSSKDPRLLRLLQTVALLCLRHNISLKAFHVPGVFQLYADAGSRLHCRQELLNFLLRAYATCYVCPTDFACHALSPATASFLHFQVASLGLSTPARYGSSNSRMPRARSGPCHPLFAPGGTTALSAGLTRSTAQSRNWPTTSVGSWTVGSAHSAVSGCTLARSLPTSAWRACRT